MRISKDHLTFKALCALAQAATQCHDSPIQRTVALRFALAYLYAVSECDRNAFDEFWRLVADPMSKAYSEPQGNYIRSSYAHRALGVIARGVGYPETPEAIQRLALWRTGAKPVPPDVKTID